MQQLGLFSAETLRLSDVTEINYFKKNPRPFCLLAKELYPGNFAPTPVHYFIKLLADKGVCQTVAFCGVRPHFENSSVVTSVECFVTVSRPELHAEH